MYATDIGSNIQKIKNDFYVTNNPNAGEKVKFTYKGKKYIGIVQDDKRINEIIPLRETLIKENMADKKEQIMNQFRIGTMVEKEHKDTYEWIKEQYEKNKEWPKPEDVFRRIAADHIKETEDYYSQLMNAGLIDEKLTMK